MDAVAEFAVEAVTVEQRKEELKILLFAVVRRGGHQQQMPRVAAEGLRQAIPASLFEFGAEVVGGQLMGFVEDYQVPAGGAELGLEILVVRHLVESHDHLMMILERVIRRRRRFEGRRVDVELQAELLEQLVAPLIHETTGGDDQDASRVGPHDEFADVKPRHDGLARAGVVGEHVAQRLPGEHRLVDGGNLMG